MTSRNLLLWVVTLLAIAVLVRIGVDLVRNPWKTLDLIDKNGQPDHGKVTGWAAFVFVYALEAYQVLVLQHPLGQLDLIVLMALPFGWIGVRTFFAWRQATFTLGDIKSRTTTEQTTRIIQEPDLFSDDERG